MNVPNFRLVRLYQVDPIGLVPHVVDLREQSEP